MKIIIVHGEKPFRGGQIHREFVARLNKAVQLCREDKFDALIISGGQTRKNISTEARQGFEYLKGKINNRVILEDKSRSTSENIQYTKTLVNNLGQLDKNSEIYAITSAKRNRRARYMYFMLWPEAAGAVKFAPAEDAYPWAVSLLEKIYFFFALIDPYEKVFGRVAKKLFRNG